MNLYNQTFEQALDQNAINEENWKNYKENVTETRKSVNTFLKSCKMDVMVPLGKKAFVRGTLQHTNDILVSHSSNYFSLVSNFQANEILQYRNQVCEQKLKELDNEKDFFRGKLDVSNNDVFSEQEIIEEYNEQAEEEWRIKHRESIKKYKLQEAEERKTQADSEINDLLDEYELMEEMTGELETLEENEDYDYDTLLKFISGEAKAPETKKRISYETDSTQAITSDEMKTEEIKQSDSNPVDSKFKHTEEITQQESSHNKENHSAENVEPKKKRPKRKVRFSTSLEDVKIIETKFEQSAFPPIQITFEHSNEKFNPDIFNGTDDDVKFKHPGEIIKILSHVDSEHPKAKSILKETNYKYDNKPDPKLQSYASVDEDIYESLSKFPLICGDVIERKTDELTIVNEKEKTGKKVSKFKELRSKVK